MDLGGLWQIKCDPRSIPGKDSLNCKGVTLNCNSTILSIFNYCQMRSTKSPLLVVAVIKMHRHKLTINELHNFCNNTYQSGFTINSYLHLQEFYLIQLSRRKRREGCTSVIKRGSSAAENYYLLLVLSMVLCWVLFLCADI